MDALLHFNQLESIVATEQQSLGYAMPVRKEKLSAFKYIELTNSDLSDQIKKVEFVPGKMRSKNFGSYIVTYKTPVLRTG